MRVSGRVLFDLVGGVNHSPLISLCEGKVFVTNWLPHYSRLLDMRCSNHTGPGHLRRGRRDIAWSYRRVNSRDSHWIAMISDWRAMANVAVGGADGGRVFSDFLVQVIDGDVFALAESALVRALLLLNHLSEFVQLLFQNLDFLVFLFNNTRSFLISLSLLSEQLSGQGLYSLVGVNEFLS